MEDKESELNNDILEDELYWEATHRVEGVRCDDCGKISKYTDECGVCKGEICEDCMNEHIYECEVNEDGE